MTNKETVLNELHLNELHIDAIVSMKYTSHWYNIGFIFDGR